MEVTGKIRISLDLSFSCQIGAISGFWNCPEEIEKLVEHFRIYNFVLYLAYDSIVVSLLFWILPKEYI